MYLGLALISKALVLLTNFFLIKPKQILFDPSHSVRPLLCYHTPSLEVKAHWLCSSELWHAQCASSMVQTYYAVVHLCAEVQKVIKRWSEQSEQASWTVLLAYPLFLPNMTEGTSLSFCWQKLKDVFSHSESPAWCYHATSLTIHTFQMFPLLVNLLWASRCCQQEQYVLLMSQLSCGTVSTI